jgi:hypothetical protein
MPQQRPIQTNFTSGELSPRMRGRVDLDQYRNGAAELRNVLVQMQGGATRRPGSTFIAATKTAGGRVRLYPFVVASLTAYVLEFGDGYVRFMRNRAQLLAGSTPLELATPYSVNELRELRFSQSADVLYVTHVNHAPRKISRTSASTFTIETVAFQNGPYDTENTGDIGATGSGAATAPETGSGSGGTTGSGSGSGGDWFESGGGEGESGGGEGEGGGDGP